MVHEEKAEALVLVIEEEGVPWYYDIMKFLELEVYPNGADKRERRSIRIMVMQYILVAIDDFGFGYSSRTKVVKSEGRALKTL